MVAVKGVFDRKIATHHIMPGIRKPNSVVFLIILIFFILLEGVNKFIRHPQPGRLDPGRTGNHQRHHRTIQEDGIGLIDNRVVKIAHELIFDVGSQIIKQVVKP